MTDVTATEFLAAEFSRVERPPRFQIRPQPIPGDRRSSWRLCVTLLLLRKGRANRLAMEHLHVLWWAVRSQEAQEQFIRALGDARRPEDVIVRFDPALAYTVDLAQGFGFVMLDGDKVQITPAGLAVSDMVWNQQDALLSIRSYLRQLPNKISGKQFQQILEWG